MSFLPSEECGKFKLKKALQNGKILACTKKSEICATSSSVAGEGATALPIGLPTKMQNKKSTTFLALLRLSFALDWTKRWFKV